MKSSGSYDSGAPAAAGECNKSCQKMLLSSAGRPFTAWEVLRHESSAIAAGRAERRRLGLIGAEACESPLRAGLAISGGGIRSGTFALGGLQALAERKLLPQLDYLSTVSGGGYIGCWLAAWIQRQGFKQVQDDLHDNKSSENVDHHDPHYLEPSPIHFLRKYTSYLTPRVGLVSGDTWAAAATYLRNLLLNQAILIGCTILALLVPRLLAWAYTWPKSDLSSVVLWAVFMVSWLLAAVFAGFGMGVFNRTVSKMPVFPSSLRIWLDPAWFVVPAMLSTFTGAFAIFGVQGFPSWLLTLQDWLGSVSHGVFGARFFQDAKSAYVAPIVAGIIVTGTLTVIVYGVGAIVQKKECTDKQCGDQKCEDLKPVRKSLWHLVIAAVAAGAAVGGMFYLYFQYLSRTPCDPVKAAMLVTTLGPPALILITVLAGWLQIGVMGTAFPDAKREWMARAAGVCMILGLSWLLFSAIALYSPMLVHACIVNGKHWSLLVPPAWLGTVLAGLKAARSSKTGDKKGSSPALGWLAKLAPPVFIVGLTMILAWFIEQVIGPLGKNAFVADDQWTHLWILLAAAVLAGLLIFFVDVNEFSMHLFYRNRLVRAYLGASNLMRNPHPFTGFALDDDLMLKDFDPQVPPPKQPAYAGPYPLICTALNLVGGDDLAWQERKAASFIYSPMYCGYDHMPSKQHNQLNQQGYRPTCCFSGPDGPHVGTAMAASGAAASPNMGYHSSPAVAVLMTFFDVRLGWWVGNPRDNNTWQNYGPRSFYLMNELLSKTDDESRYLYLSDGGHFENLGVYELVRRRLNLIVCFDGDADGSYEFGDLGNLIERCRRDFGTNIKIRVNKIQPAGEPPLSASHFAIGKIEYPKLAERKQSEGWLLYIKSSICGTEPGDVLAYRRMHPDFPHDPTADQFFTESQFESYRALGHHAVMTTINQLLGANEPVCVEDVIEVLRNLDRLPH